MQALAFPSKERVSESLLLTLWVEGVNAKSPGHQRQRPASGALAAEGCALSSTARQGALLTHRLSTAGSNRR